MRTRLCENFSSRLIGYFRFFQLLYFYMKSENVQKLEICIFFVKMAVGNGRLIAFSNIYIFFHGVFIIMGNYYHEDEKKSSSTAKTALGLAIGGLSLAAVQGGLFGGAEGTGGGLLGGLFGNGNANQLARGRQAETELAVINQYLMPTWAELCNLKQEVAVNKAIEQKNHEITGLLFKRAEENTAAGFELNKMRTESAFALARQEQQCCCDKANARIDYVSALQAQKTDAAFALADQKTNSNLALIDQKTDSNFALLDQKTNANFRQLSSDTDCAYKRLDSKIDGAFIINNLETDSKICEATKYMVRGNVYLSPKSMADPYEAGTNILMSRHVYPAYSSSWTNWGGCGCAGTAGAANGFGW